MKRRFFVVFAALLSQGFAYAETDAALSKCASMENSVSRLVCFDDLAKERGAAPTAVSTTSDGAGKWRTSTDTDPLTDKSVYFAMLLSDSGESRFNRKPLLVVRCKDNKTELYITWHDFLGTNSIATTYRIDKDAAQQSKWSLSTDKKAAFFPGSPIQMLKRLSESTSFVANVTPYNESPVTAVFDTTGANKALSDLRKGCGW